VVRANVYVHFPSIMASQAVYMTLTSTPALCGHRLGAQEQRSLFTRALNFQGTSNERQLVCQLRVAILQATWIYSHRSMLGTEHG
jgi:hypothetical protein